MKLLDRCRGAIAGRQIRAEICRESHKRRLTGNIAGWQTSCGERASVAGNLRCFGLAELGGRRPLAPVRMQPVAQRKRRKKGDWEQIYERKSKQGRALPRWIRRFSKRPGSRQKTEGLRVDAASRGGPQSLQQTWFEMIDPCLLSVSKKSKQERRWWQRLSKTARDDRGGHFLRRC